MGLWSSESRRYDRSIQPQPAETDHQFTGGMKESVQIGSGAMFPVLLPRKTPAGALGTRQPAPAVAWVLWKSFHAYTSVNLSACSGNQMEPKPQCLKTVM